MAEMQQEIKKFCVLAGKRVSLNDFDPNYAADFVKKEDADELLEEGVRQLASYQDRLYAENNQSLLVIFQAMDASGKDGAIKHVMSGLNPQGTQVFSFKVPSAEELDHDYLWRCVKALPERGRIGIFNRSHYEEVLVVRVHPDFLEKQPLPAELKNEHIWEQRYDQINNFEKHLVENGTQVVKFFLHISKDEQKKRFLERIQRPDKNWKFAIGDVYERQHWDQYMQAYEGMLSNTSTRWAPWYVIPADKKWFTRLAVSAVLIEKFKEMDPQYPELSEKQRSELVEAARLLDSES
jgi:PPK2 family polyphosphate:nucleotide phosphotransferase